MKLRQLVKLLRAVQIISGPRGASVAELSKELGIDRSNVPHMLAGMEELGIRLYDDKPPMERSRRYYLDQDYVKELHKGRLVPNVDLTLEEIITLYLLKSHGNIYRGTELEETIERAYKKLGAFLPEKLIPMLERVKVLFLPVGKGTKDYSDKEPIIDKLTDAVLQQRTAIVHYHSFYDDKVKRFRIDPLHFFEHRGGLYIFVRTPRFNEIRMLAVERIQSMHVTEDRFTYPENFDPRVRLDAAFNLILDETMQVRVWFSRSAARYVRERNWSVDQSIEEAPDGGIVLSMQTSGFDEVKSWVLSFGAGAKVLEPKALVDAVREELGKAGEMYG